MSKKYSLPKPPKGANKKTENIDIKELRMFNKMLIMN